MKPQEFSRDQFGPGAEIDFASDGTPLVNGIGWICGYCESLWAELDKAEVCCTEDECFIVVKE